MSPSSLTFTRLEDEVLEGHSCEHARTAIDFGTMVPQAGDQLLEAKPTLLVGLAAGVYPYRRVAVGHDAPPVAHGRGRRSTRVRSECPAGESFAVFIDDPAGDRPPVLHANGVGCLTVASSSKEANELAVLLEESDPPQAVRVELRDREGGARSRGSGSQGKTSVLRMSLPFYRLYYPGRPARFAAACRARRLSVSSAAPEFSGGFTSTIAA